MNLPYDKQFMLRDFFTRASTRPEKNEGKRASFMAHWQRGKFVSNKLKKLAPMGAVRQRGQAASPLVVQVTRYPQRGVRDSHHQDQFRG